MSKDYLPYLDGWRGLAIVCLLIGHFFPVPGINFGAVGVNLFFVLSGFLMTRILFVQKTPLRVFYLRRIARIFPSVYIFLAVVALTFLLAGRDISRMELISAATFTNNYFTPEGKWTMPVGHIWSLSVEEHAYVVLSIVAVMVRHNAQRSLRAVALVVGAIAGIALLYWSLGETAGFDKRWAHTEVAAFGIFASGLAYLYGLRHALPAARLAAPALLLSGLAAHWWSVPDAVRLILGCGAFALALNALPRAPRLLRSVLELTALRQLGIWSFSLYLWQQPFYQLVRHEGMHPLGGLAMSLVVGVAAYYTIEKPARSYLNQRWSKPAPSPIHMIDSEEAEPLHRP